VYLLAQGNKKTFGVNKTPKVKKGRV